MAKTKTVEEIQVNDADLVKALNEMTAAVEKGDRLLAADPEGGLSTQGEQLSKKTPKGVVYGVSKADACSDDESSDDGSSDDDDAKKSCEHVFKGQLACRSCAATIVKADDESSGDDESSEDVDKSQTVAKGAVDVSEFLTGMRDDLSAVAEGFDTLKKSVDDRISAQVSAGQAFNQRLAQGITMIGNAVIAIQKQLGTHEAQLTKALSQPAFAGAPGFSHRALLGQNELMHPSLGAGDGEQSSGIYNLTPNTIRNWLLSKAEAGDVVAGEVIIEYESNNCDPGVFARHPMVRKSLEHDLCK